MDKFLKIWEKSLIISLRIVYFLAIFLGIILIVSSLSKNISNSLITALFSSINICIILSFFIHIGTFMTVCLFRGFLGTKKKKGVRLIKFHFLFWGFILLLVLITMLATPIDGSTIGRDGEYYLGILWFTTYESSDILISRNQFECIETLYLLAAFVIVLKFMVLPVVQYGDNASTCSMIARGVRRTSQMINFRRRRTL